MPHKFYAMSPESRKSLTIFEIIDAAGNFPPPPMIVIEGKELMMSFFPPELPDGTKVVVSDSGFTSHKISLIFLDHYIKNSNAGPNSDWKLMLMDSHGSHLTPEFITLANDNHIRHFTLIPHFTHCMQPLDVGVFHPYKHYHDMAIQDALADFCLEYSLTKFLDDLGKIRTNTLKQLTIKHAFEKCGTYPPNAKKCIQQFKKFHPDLKKPNAWNGDDELELPRHPRVLPQTLTEVQHGMREWADKMHQGMVWSDPVRPESSRLMFRLPRLSSLRPCSRRLSLQYTNADLRRISSG
jgi:hypothetical protein